MIGEIWFKRRQESYRCRYFKLTEKHQTGYSGITVKAYSDFVEVFYLGDKDVEGFENKNRVLSEGEIAKHMLEGSLRAII